MSLQKLILFALVASALLNLFSIGLQASLQDATYLFRRPGELVRALLAMNVLMPLFAVTLISFLDFNPAVKIALVALSVSPIPPPTPAKMVKSGGTELVRDRSAGRHRFAGDHRRATRDGDHWPTSPCRAAHEHGASCQGDLHIGSDSNWSRHPRAQSCACLR